MKVNLLKNYGCMFCDKTAPKDFSLCPTCYRFKGFTPLPAGWNYWIESDFVFSSPKRIVCDECSKGASNISEKDPRPQKPVSNPCPECGHGKYK